MADYESDLNILRTLAVERDWSSLQDTLGRLLLELDIYTVLEIAATRAHNHLPIFEGAHPQSIWARQLLVGIVSYGVAPTELPPEAAQPYASPGATNFVAALLDLARGVERQTPLENRLRFLGSAISNVMLADLAAFWYGQHPYRWLLQQERGHETDPNTGDTVRHNIYVQFWLDEAVAERDTAAWLALADQLEAKLSK